MSQVPIAVILLLIFGVGFGAGYGVREMISSGRRRRYSFGELGDKAASVDGLFGWLKGELQPPK